MFHTQSIIETSKPNQQKQANKMATKKLKITNLPDNQKAIIEWELENGNFAASGRIYQRSTCWSAGQNLDEILKLAPNDTRVQRIVKVWEEYHLNHLTAGSPAQESHLKTLVVPKNLYPMSHYDWDAFRIERAKVRIV